MMMITDFASWVYLTEAIVCGAGFVVFLWWWVRQKTASEVYAYITLLLLATCVERAGALCMRGLIFYDIEKAQEAIYSLSWTLRTVPGTVIMSLIVFRMASRAVRTVGLEKRYKDGSHTCEEDFHDD